MITHTMSDLDALPTVEDRFKAAGFVERAGMVICGGLPPGEMGKLTRVVQLSRVEQALLQSWSSPPTFNRQTGREDKRPGLGRFLIKVGGRPGIPVRVQLTAIEQATRDTNKLWLEISRVGRRELSGDTDDGGGVGLEPATGLGLPAGGGGTGEGLG